MTKKSRKSPERVVMSSIIPRGLSKKLFRFLERILPVKLLDALYEFFIQTRILLSNALLLMLVALFAFFCFATIQKETFRESDVFSMLLVQAIALAVLLHMSLWETERESRTFELLIMRIPGIHRLIWYKLKVSLFWNLVLLLPFFAGFMWFVSIPLWRVVIYLFFCFSVAVFAALFTCVVSSFVKRGLPTALIAAIALFSFFGFMSDAPIPKKEYFNIFLNPLTESIVDYWSSKRIIVMVIINRLVLLSFILIIYRWFYKRLSKTEKWIY